MTNILIHLNIRHGKELFKKKTAPNSRARSFYPITSMLAPQRSEHVYRQNASLAGGQFLVDCSKASFKMLGNLVGLLNLMTQVLIERGTGARGDKTSHDDVLLEPAQVVDLGGQRGLGEDLGRLLETRGRDEALG